MSFQRGYTNYDMWIFFKNVGSFILKNRAIFFFPLLKFLTVIIFIAIGIISYFIFPLPLFIIALIILIFSLIYTEFFIHTAYVAVLLKWLMNVPVSLSYGFKIAWQRPQIIKFLFGSTLVLFFTMIFHKKHENQKIKNFRSEAFWSAPSYFLLPIIITDNLNAKETIYRAVEIGYPLLLSINFNGIKAMIFLIMLMVIDTLLQFHTITSHIFIALSCAILIFFIAFSEYAETILKCVLFLYVVERKLAYGFDADVIDKFVA